MRNLNIGTAQSTLSREAEGTHAHDGKVGNSHSVGKNKSKSKSKRDSASFGRPAQAPSICMRDGEAVSKLLGLAVWGGALLFQVYSKGFRVPGLFFS